MDEFYGTLCPPFGAEIELPRIRTESLLQVHQPFPLGLPSAVEAIRAELLVDDTVFATSSPGRIDGEGCWFTFPQDRVYPATRYGVRYIIRRHGSETWEPAQVSRPLLAKKVNAEGPHE